MKNNATQTQLKPASFGSISHGTLRTEDLLEAFGSELEWQIRRNGTYFALPENFSERDRLNAIVGEWQDTASDGIGNVTDEDLAEELVNSTLPDALQTFAPAYAYFGSHPGDGSDFGYWVDVESVKEQVEFVSAEDEEYPSDCFQGEWLHVNDHGNCTLYVRENGHDREIWAIV